MPWAKRTRVNQHFTRLEPVKDEVLDMYTFQTKYRMYTNCDFVELWRQPTLCKTLIACMHANQAIRESYNSDSTSQMGAARPRTHPLYIGRYCNPTARLMQGTASNRAPAVTKACESIHAHLGNSWALPLSVAVKKIRIMACVLSCRQSISFLGVCLYT